jgi:hypothetical protein
MVYKLAIVAIFVALILCIGCAPGQIPLASNGGDPIKSQVWVKADKSVYEQGENITIRVTNLLGKSLFYSGSDRFWDLDKYEGDKWVNIGYKSSGGFQLANENIGDGCSIRLFERMTPIELKPDEEISTKWDQKACPFESRITKYIEPGFYRFEFTYGDYNHSNEDFSDEYFSITNPEIAYSDSFEIKS